MLSVKHSIGKITVDGLNRYNVPAQQNFICYGYAKRTTFGSLIN